MDANENLFAACFNSNDVTVYSKKRVFKKCFAIDDYELSYKTYGGNESRKLLREIFERDQEAVAILPYDRDTGEILLIEQFRPGALRDPKTPWLVEIVAGMIDEGESPLQAAVRELREEARLEVAPEQLHLVTAEYSSPGGTSERIYIYTAGVSLAHISSHGGLESENEDIRIFKVKASDAFEQCRAGGRICNGTALIAIQHFQIYFDQYMKLKNPQLICGASVPQTPSAWA